MCSNGRMTLTEETKMQKRKKTAAMPHRLAFRDFTVLKPKVQQHQFGIEASN